LQPQVFGLEQIRLADAPHSKTKYTNSCSFSFLILCETNLKFKAAFISIGETSGRRLNRKDTQSSQPLRTKHLENVKV